MDFISKRVCTQTYSMAVFLSSKSRFLVFCRNSSHFPIECGIFWCFDLIHQCLTVFYTFSKPISEMQLKWLGITG